MLFSVLECLEIKEEICALYVLISQYEPKCLVLEVTDQVPLLHYSTVRDFIYIYVKDNRLH